MLISDAYVAQNAELHRSAHHYGTGAWRKKDLVRSIYEQGRHGSILDYGCGKGSLKQALADLPVHEYDPAINGKAEQPAAADLVVCLDVLEHVEPEYLDNVLIEIARLTIKQALFTIALVASEDRLPDGRNAHLIVKPSEWWLRKLSEFFCVESSHPFGSEVVVVVSPSGGLISNEYRALNRKLHEDRRDFGSYGHNWAELITDIAGLHDLTSVLDYGCGKGTLKTALHGMDVREYDPAIPGKEAPPKPADVVVCLDVLEHVEPDRIDAVIQDLRRCTGVYLLVNISTTNSTKKLADGRNAHLIIENADWWRKKLEGLFHFHKWNPSPDGNSVTGFLQPLRQLGAIHSKCAVGHEERQEQVRINIARRPERLISDPKKTLLPDNGRKAVLICFGPSLQRTWPTAALECLSEDADLFTVSAAHRYMVERGVIPMAHMDCDPREHKVRQIGKPHLDVEYWLASCVHPFYLDLLRGHKVRLWHAYNGERSMEALEWEPGQRMIVGGGSIGVRAMSLLYYLGYRRFSIHGMDCSFERGAHYAGEHLGKIKDVMPIKIGDKEFETNAAFVVYARYFMSQCRWMKGAEVELHGDGLLRHMAAMPQNSLKPADPVA